MTTNALELGIDIGSLDACVMAGYAGSIASTWQRAGRAGRRSGTSCAVFVASSAPLDQFIVQHPEYFFGSSPEHAHIQPDNLEILVNHLKCAAFELPLSPDERFGEVELPELCERLGEAGFLQRSGGNWHWVQESYPADTISLRSVTSDNFVIIDTTGGEDGKPEVIGEVDFSSALTTVHPKAIYIHQGQQYHVERLDFGQRKAYVKRVDVDYFTDAIRYTQVRVLEIAEEQRIAGPAARAHGDVLVRSQVVGFKKIKFFTNENVGSGKLELPENEMHTTAFWVTLQHELLAGLPFTLSERQSGIFGLVYALASMATLLLMCDRRDLGTAVGERPPNGGAETEWQEFASGTGTEKELFEPNLYLYDAYPGGIGFSEPLYRACQLLLARTRELIAACPCDSGCPSCVGPAGDKSERSKEVALAILEHCVPERSRHVQYQEHQGYSTNVSHTTTDRFARLKALQRPSLCPRQDTRSGRSGTRRRRRSAACSGTAVGCGEAGAASGGLGQAESAMANTCHCTVGMATMPRVPQMLQHCGYSHRMHPKMSLMPEQWLFLDTETTGLAGGTGTYPFLVGLAWWKGGGLEVEQLFMREYSEERSLLAALAERMAERPCWSRSTASPSTGHCSKPAIG